MLRSQVTRLRLASAKCLQQNPVKDGSRSSFSSQKISSLKTDFSKSEIRACYRLFHRSGILDSSSKFQRFWILSSSNLPRISIGPGCSQFHTSSSQNYPKVNPPEDGKKGNFSNSVRSGSDNFCHVLVDSYSLTYFK